MFIEKAFGFEDRVDPVKRYPQCSHNLYLWSYINRLAWTFFLPWWLPWSVDKALNNHLSYVWRWWKSRWDFCACSLARLALTSASRSSRSNRRLIFSNWLSFRTSTRRSLFEIRIGGTFSGRWRLVDLLFGAGAGGVVLDELLPPSLLFWPVCGKRDEFMQGKIWS